MKTFLFTLLVCLMSYGQVSAHPHSILGCQKNIQYKQAALLSEEVLPNGLYAERYDTNHDTRVDVIALSAVLASRIHIGADGEDTVEVVHADHPTFYMVDKDYDDAPDALYIDKGPGGNCDDIVLYRNLRGPQTPNAVEPKGNAL